MKKNIVAIVGRPNVGKSTLFNRICGKRSAIVDFEEGVTRDRKYETTQWNGKEFTLVDTGGITFENKDKISTAIRKQAEIAIEEADIILFLVDAKVVPTDTDEEIARILRRHSEKVILVANKVDSDKDFPNIFEYMKLGFGEPIPIAAANGRNTGNMLDMLTDKIPEYKKQVPDENIINIAIVGKPNVGKSSIINKLMGQNATIVSDIPGTTRDSIDMQMKYFGKTLNFIDTAGLRKKSKIKYGVEYFSIMRTIDSINRADIVLLILDATQNISVQDQRIASYIKRNYKDLIIIFNKWDLIEKDTYTVGEYIKKIKDKLGFVDYAPVIFTSALTGQRVRKILDKILEVEEKSNTRIPTSQLNKFLEMILAKFPPSHSSGKHSKIYYCTQTDVHPPTFVFFCNNPKLITVHYKRFINNQLREYFDFKGASFKVMFRGKKENE